MGRGARRAPFHGVARVGHDLVTKPTKGSNCVLFIIATLNSSPEC